MNIKIKIAEDNVVISKKELILMLSASEAKFLYTLAERVSKLDELIEPWNTDTEEFAEELMSTLDESGIYNDNMA